VLLKHTLDIAHADTKPVFFPDQLPASPGKQEFGSKSARQDTRKMNTRILHTRDKVILEKSFFMAHPGLSKCLGLMVQAMMFI
jgi:hypothetical protein